MAINETVRLIIEGADEGASAALEAVAGNLGGVGQSLLNFATNPATVAIGAAVAVGAAAFDMSQQVSTAMNLFSAQTGLAGDELRDFESAALAVFNNNWGDSFADVAESMALVRQITQGTADEVEGITQNALIMRDAFGIDVQESVSRAQTLMEEFGLTSQEAFDFIAFGVQNGLNANGDFMDSIGEYSNLFSDAGFSASEFFSIMETGAAGGVLGTDKIADAVKEMGIILNEGGEGARTAFETIGLSYDDVSAKVAAGTTTWAAMFPTIVEGINSIEDPIARSQAQVALFGTMAEDLGVSFTEGLTSASTALEEMSGATTAAGETMSQGLGPAWEDFKRALSTALIPLGDIIAKILTGVIPVLETLGHNLSFLIPQAIDVAKAVINNRIDLIHAKMTFWADVFIAAGQKWQATWDTIKSGVSTAWAAISPIFDAIQRFADWLSGVSFDFQINIPDIPEWMLPGSPIPLHTRWKDFGDYLDRQTFTPQFDTSQAEPVFAAANPGNFSSAGFSQPQNSTFAANGGGGTQITVNIYDDSAAALLLNYLEGAY